MAFVGRTGVCGCGGCEQRGLAAPSCRDAAKLPPLQQDLLARLHLFWHVRLLACLCWCCRWVWAPLRVCVCALGHGVRVWWCGGAQA